MKILGEETMLNTVVSESSISHQWNADIALTYQGTIVSFFAFFKWVTHTSANFTFKSQIIISS